LCCPRQLPVLRSSCSTVRVGLLGKYFNMVGIQIAFTTLAVIMAQIFVASPFYLRQAKSLFEQIDPAYEQTSRTLGASPVRTLFLVTLPMTTSGLISGAVMTFGRALGEFGATIMFAGNVPRDYPDHAACRSMSGCRETST